jgi:hypothetical protein
MGWVPVLLLGGGDAFEVFTCDMKGGTYYAKRRWNRPSRHWSYDR